MIGTRFNPATAQIDLVQNNALNPRTSGIIYDDFISRIGTAGYLGWTAATAGTTWSNTSANPTNVFNVGLFRQQITHSAAATATSVVHIGTTGPVRLTAGVVKLEAFVRVEPTPAQVTARQYWVGIQDTASVGPTNAVLVGFTQPNTLVNATWECRCVRASATTTTAVATSTVVNNTWTRIGFEVNTAASSVSWFVNGVLIGSNAVNIPLSTINLFPVFWMSSTSNAVAAAYGHNIDFYILKKFFNPTRF